MGDKTFDFSSKNWDFLPKKVQIWPKNGFFCSFLARPCRLIWLVVVARGLYLARHLFTLLEKTEVVKKRGRWRVSFFLLKVKKQQRSASPLSQCWKKKMALFVFLVCRKRHVDVLASFCGLLCWKVHVIRAANRQTRGGQTNKT